MFATLIGLPRWAKAGIGIIGLGLAFVLWLHFHDRAVVNADRVKAQAAAAVIAREADQAAHTQVETTQTEVEQTNAEARTAASGSDDPLGSALERLRTAKAGPGTPAR